MFYLNQFQTKKEIIMNNLKKWIILLAVLVLVNLLVALENVSDFRLENLQGKQVNLSDYQEKGLIIIDFGQRGAVHAKKLFQN